MKKILLPMLLVVLTLGGCASESCFAGIIHKRVRGSGNVVEEQRKVSGFSKVHLSGFGNLKIELGDEEDLRIKAEDNLLPHLETYVRGATLIIEIEDNINLDPTEPIYYYLTAKKLNAISVSGSGSVEAPKLEAEEFSANVSGSGDMHIDGLVCDSAKVDISGTGDIKIDSLSAELVEADISGSGSVSIGNGKVGEQRIEISGSGNYEAKGLESVRADVGLSGTASVVLWVSDHLKADINGAGSIDYVGKPEVDLEISGSGSVKRIEE